MKTESLDAAVTSLEAALTTRRAKLGDKDLRIAESLTLLGSAYCGTDRKKEARELYREGEDIYQSQGRSGKSYRKC